MEGSRQSSSSSSNESENWDNVSRDRSVSLSTNASFRHPSIASFEKREKKPLLFEPFLAEIYAITLEKCTEEISLIALVNKLPIVDIDLQYVPLAVKYANYQYDPDRIYGGPTRQTLHKFKRELSRILKILKLTVTDLRQNRNINSLIEILHDEKINKELEEAIIMTKRFTDDELNHLRILQEAELKQFTGLIQKTTEDLGRNKDLLNDNVLECEVKMRYFKKWQQSLIQQNHMQLTNQSDVFIDIIDKTDIEIDREKRVHSEIVEYLNEDIQDLQAEAKEWQQKYEKDMEEKDDAISELQIEVYKMDVTYNRLKNLHDKRRKEMADYLLEREKRRQAAIELDRQTRAATKIQSWWRAVMFRKKLGPYRKKKGKKGGKGANKKK